MAESIKFNGANRCFSAVPMYPDDTVPVSDPMWGYSNGAVTFTRWRLSPEEITQIAQTGEVWLAVRCGSRPMQPHWLGSLNYIKQACADMGGLWGSTMRKLAPRKGPEDPQPA